MKRYVKEILASPLFAGIEEKEILPVMRCADGKIGRYRKGSILAMDSNEIRYVGVVLEGSIHMVKENSQGDQTLLAMIRKGELFGESFVCGGRPLTYTTFLAAQDAVILFLPFQKILHTCSRACEVHRRLIENMVPMLAEKNVRLMEKIDVSSQKSIREKILVYLKLQEEKLASGQGEWMELPVSRTVMAEYLGVNRSALTRELAKMKTEGLLDFEKNRFRMKET